MTAPGHPVTITGEQWQSLARIAQRTATLFPARTPYLDEQSRFEAAYDGVTGWVHAHGWPDDDKPLWRAASAGIQSAARESYRHLSHRWLWLAPSGGHDALADDVAERIGAAQLAGAFSAEELECLILVGQEGGRDRNRLAAMLGITRTQFDYRLDGARRRARVLWIAPGETPRGYYRASRGGRKSKAAVARYRREARARRESA